MQTLVIQPDAAAGIDTTIDSADPLGLSTNYHTDTLLYVGTVAGKASPQQRRICMDWDLSSLSADAVIVDAQLDLTDNAGTAGTYTGKVYRITVEDMVEDARWNQSGGGTDWTPGGTYTEKSGISFSYDYGDDLIIEGEGMVALCNYAVQSNSGSMKILIALDADIGGPLNTTTNQQFYSSDHGTAGYRPKLTIQYTLVNAWTGDVDGDLDTAGNWSAGTVPNTNTERVIFNSGASTITTGSLATNSATVCFGPNFAGNFGTAASPLSIQATEIIYSMTTGSWHGDIHSGTACNFFMSNSQASTSSFSMTGDVDSVFVTGTKGEMEIDANLSTAIVTGAGSRFPVVYFTDATTFPAGSGQGLNVGSNARVRTDDVARFTTSGSCSLRVDGTADSVGHRSYVLNKSRVDYRANGFALTSFSGEGKGSIGNRATLDVSLNDRDDLDFGATFDVVGGTLKLANGMNTLNVDDLVVWDGGLELDAGTTITPTARPT